MSFGTQASAGIKYGVPNGTKLRGIEVNRAAYLPAKSAKFRIKRHLAQPLRRSNMLNLVPLGTPYLFPADVCVPNSPIIEYGHRILSKPLLTTTDQKCFTSLLTDHKSILLHQDFQLKIPNSSFFYGLSSHSTFYSVSHRLSVDNDF